MKYASETKRGVGIGVPGRAGVRLDRLGFGFFPLVVFLCASARAFGARARIQSSSYCFRASSPTVDPVEPHGAADVHAVAEIPRGSRGSCDRAGSGPGPRTSNHLSFVENVLLQRDPVLFTPREDLLHEGVEVVRGRVAGSAPQPPAAHRKAPWTAQEVRRAIELDTRPPGAGWLRM